MITWQWTDQSQCNVYCIIQGQVTSFERVDLISTSDGHYTDSVLYATTRVTSWLSTRSRTTSWTSACRPGLMVRRRDNCVSVATRRKRRMKMLCATPLHLTLVSPSITSSLLFSHWLPAVWGLDLHRTAHRYCYLLRNGLLPFHWPKRTCIMTSSLSLT